MGRMPRIQIEGAIYYLKPACNSNEPIFRSDKDYVFYMALLTRYMEKSNFKIFAFCLTPHSIDLLIEPSGSATISRIMHDLNPGYTKYYNGKYKRTGRLFRERYHMVLIEKAPNLLSMTAYIHLRPKLLHVTNKINTYKYSSFSTYLTARRTALGAEISGGTEGNKPKMADEVAYVLGCLKDKSYQQFVNEMEAGEAKELDKRLEKEKIIGSVSFLKDIESKLKDEREEPGRQAPAEEPEALPEPVPAEEPEALPKPAPVEELKTLPEPVPADKPEALIQPLSAQAPMAPARHKSYIWISIAAACLVILSFIISMFLARLNISRSEETMRQEMARKDVESQSRLAAELDKTSKELVDSYEAKLASSRETIESLETQKQRAEDELLKAKTSLRLRNGALKRKRTGLQVN